MTKGELVSNIELSASDCRHFANLTVIVLRN